MVAGLALITQESASASQEAPRQRSGWFHITSAPGDWKRDAAERALSETIDQRGTHGIARGVVIHRLGRRRGAMGLVDIDAVVRELLQERLLRSARHRAAPCQKDAAGNHARVVPVGVHGLRGMRWFKHTGPYSTDAFGDRLAGLVLQDP